MLPPTESGLSSSLQFSRMVYRQRVAISYIKYSQCDMEARSIGSVSGFSWSRLSSSLDYDGGMSPNTATAPGWILDFYRIAEARSGRGWLRSFFCPCAILKLLPRPEGILLILMADAPNPDFLRRAIALATENVIRGRGGPFAAVIVREGVIVGEGVNTVTATHDPTAHGEVNAIRAAAKALGTFTLAGCELYTSCEPCPMCLAASYWARLNAIYYGACAADAARAGFDDAFLYGEMRKDAPERTLPAVQLLGDEAWASFAAWLDSPKRVDY
jgi:guanine deaminase